MTHFGVPTPWRRRKATPTVPIPRGTDGPRAVRDPGHAPKHREREPGDPALVCGRGGRRPHREVQGHTPMMDERGKSDRPVVPGKPPNKAGEPAAEAGEGRGLAKGNSPERNALRTPRRVGAPSALERVRQAARQDRKQRFTALLHHVYDVGRLRAAYFAVKRDAAAGIDGETWQHYGAVLKTNLQDLSQRLKRGASRAKPVRRAYIP